MNLHEYQAKSLLARFGVATPRGAVALTPDEVEGAVLALPGPVWVVKAQIHAGGRGKAGGVKVVRSAEEAIREARAMFGKVLVTPQTGREGKEVRRVYIEEGSSIARELYASLLVDRANGRVTFVASAEGGVEIEEVARTSPEKILKIAIDPASGFQPYHARKLAFGLGLEGAAAKDAPEFFGSLHTAFHALDASLLELNPLVLTAEGRLLALDAKINVDDNALFRHKDLLELRDPSEEDATEREAARHELSYVKLDGNIGCLVNGAGLAMATMDIIKLKGGEPANFLDVGGGADAPRVTAAFRIILSDPRVRAILVNIFGGIMRCDVIAEGIVAAARELKVPVPLVVRLEGTNVDQGKSILARSGLAIIAASDLADGAEKAVAAAKGAA
jgi:succinyl-CoA synthetase beta subunit